MRPTFWTLGPASRTLGLAVVLTVGLAACGSAAAQPRVTKQGPETIASSAAAHSSAVAAPTSTTTPVPRATAPAPPATIAASVAAAPAAAPAATPNCPYPASGFDCDLQLRIAAAEAYVAARPGTTGFVLRDRQTGAVYANRYAATPVWTASTIKLAMTIALEQWNDSGQISLTAQDRSDIAAMLHSSDDDAADRLWFAYAGSDHMAFNNQFPAYGMTHLVPQSGFTNFFPYWGFQKCTPQDLDGLVQYLLGTLAPTDRSVIVSALQAVDPDQQWGVWGAGPAATPGNKDGWSLEQGGQVMNSVGFVGPGQRYTLAIMNSLNGAGGYNEGRETDTHVAALLFAGRF